MKTLPKLDKPSKWTWKPTLVLYHLLEFYQQEKGNRVLDPILECFPRFFYLMPKVEDTLHLLLSTRLFFLRQVPLLACDLDATSRPVLFVSAGLIGFVVEGRLFGFSSFFTLFFLIKCCPWCFCHVWSGDVFVVVAVRPSFCLEQPFCVSWVRSL